MNDDRPPISVDELHAFVDGQLDARRLPALLERLRDHPDDAARVLQWQAQRIGLRQLARDTDLGETPPAMAAAVRRRASALHRRQVWPQAAAAALLLGIGLAGGWYAAPRATPGGALAASPAFVQEAVMAHAVFVPEKRHPVEVGAADEAHLVQWLSRRLGAPLKVPSLIDRGYRLLGGRLLPGDDAPRAQFMYENAQGTRVTLYVAVFAPGQAPSTTAFRTAHQGRETSFYWIEDRYGYALSADTDDAELAALAREVYRQLGGA
ncbi:MAG: anti-sigma factor [Burkholderiales bacterium]|nr:anti-sigma factor [Burkholderiales bacterium]MDE2453902.1 anti-sigma factor [Burkholderiales bacterium]